jgi:hypothetical protein
VQALRDASDRISEGDLARVEREVMADYQDVFETERKIFILSCPPSLSFTRSVRLAPSGFSFSADGSFCTAAATSERSRPASPG